MRPLCNSIFDDCIYFVRIHALNFQVILKKDEYLLTVYFQISTNAVSEKEDVIRYVQTQRVHMYVNVMVDINLELIKELAQVIYNVFEL